MLPIIPADLSLDKYNYIDIAGVDEAGRGPLAGPIWAAAVIIPENGLFAEEEWINDSKKLSEEKRKILYHLIKEHYITASSHITAAQIDAMGVGEANKQVCLHAINKLAISPLISVIDGNLKFKSKNLVSLIKGDSLCRAIAAASIVAKYERDQYMQHIATLFPQYGFAKHKGYGTKAHREMILQHGACSEHRMSFLTRILG